MDVLNQIRKHLENNDIDLTLDLLGKTKISDLPENEFKEFENQISKCFENFGYRLDIDWDLRKKKYNYISNFILNHFSNNRKFELLYRIKNWEAYKILKGEDINDLHELIEYLKGVNDYNRNNTRNENFLSQTRSGYNFDSKAKQTLIFLSYFYGDLAEKMIKFSTFQEIELSLNQLSHLVARVIYVNENKFNMGGGEEYFRSCILENNEFGISSFYIQFSKIVNHDKYQIIHPELIDRGISSCEDKEELVKKIKSINPFYLHSIGYTNLISAEIANELRIKTKLGYHFWTHFVDLDGGDNVDIIKNIDRHKINENFDKKSKFVQKYFVSKFMLDVYNLLGGIDQVEVIYPLTTFDFFSINKNFETHEQNSLTNVLQVNLNEKKGGKIFFEIAKENKSKNFVGVNSEKNIDADFVNIIEEGMKSRFDNVQIVGFSNKDEIIRKADIVLIPSLVDETFSRIAFESILRNKIIITTRQGNLSYINEDGLFLDEKNDFKKILSFLEYETNTQELLYKQKLKIKSFEKEVVGNFIKSLEETSFFKKTNIGIMGQIGPSGFGQLTEHLYGVFKNLGFSTYVFAALPYEFEGSTKYFDVQEIYAPIFKNNIHTSLNYRELVTDFEINNFIETFQINTLIIPEIVNMENWKRIFSLNWENLSIISIPMLEIVNLKEFINYSHVSYNMHVTEISWETFNKYQIGDNRFIGHAREPIITSFSESTNNKITLLFVGGRNAFKRKNLERFLEAFMEVSKNRNDLFLNVSLSQSEFDKVDKKFIKPNEFQIKYLIGDFTNEEVENLILEADIGVLLSKSEGLGLGFWDFNYRGVPVLTHNGYPHVKNIDIGEDHNFVIAAKPQAMSDTPYSIFMEFEFDKNELITFLMNITKELLNDSKKEIRKINFNKQFYEYNLRILKSLNMKYDTQKGITEIQSLSSLFKVAIKLIKQTTIKKFFNIMATRRMDYDENTIDRFQTYYMYRSYAKMLAERSILLKKHSKAIRLRAIRTIKLFDKF